MIKYSILGCYIEIVINPSYTPITEIFKLDLAPLNLNLHQSYAHFSFTLEI